MYYELKTITTRLKENHMFGLIANETHQRLLRETELLRIRCTRLQKENNKMHRKMADISEIKDKFSDLVEHLTDVWYKE